MKYSIKQSETSSGFKEEIQIIFVIQYRTRSEYLCSLLLTQPLEFFSTDFETN